MNKLTIGFAVIVLLIIGVVSANYVTGRVFWSNWFKEKVLSPEKIVDGEIDSSDKERFNILRLDEDINEKEHKMIDSFKEAMTKR